jgi:hypothetical protein
MNFAFAGATSFNQSIETWNMTNVNSAFSMLSFSALSMQNYDNTLIGWSAQPLKTGVTLGADDLKYCASQTQRQSIITTFNWTITGDTLECPPIQNSNISSVACTPTTTNINTTVNCTVTTTTDLSTLSGSVNLRIDDTGTIVNCPVTGSGTTLTCNSIPVGANPGTFPAQYNASGSGTTYLDGSDVEVVLPNTEIVLADAVSLQSCTPTYPNPVNQGDTVNCTLKLTDTTTANYVLPTTTPLTFRIDNSTNQITCTQASGINCTIDNTADTITITSIPTTNSNLGSQPLNVSDDGTTFTPFNNAAFVVTPIQNSNISSVACTPTTTNINTTVNCTVTTTTDLSTLSGSVNLRIGTAGTVVNCPVTGSGTTLNCNNIPVGAVAGTFPAQYNASGSGTTYVDGDDNVVTLPTTIITAANISDSINCTPTMQITVGNTYSCTFTLTGNADNNYTLPAGGILATTQTATGNSPACTIAANQTPLVSLICTDIPLQDATLGAQNVLLLIDTDTVGVDKGDVTLFSSPITDLIFIEPSKVSFDPIEDSAVKFGSSDLTMTVGGGANDDTRFTQAGTTAVCKFRLKEFGVADNDATRGFDVSTLKLVAATTGGSYNATDKTFDVPYSTTSGCNVKIIPEQQNQPKWFFETRVVRSDTQVFGRDNAYFQTYGAIGGVSISA